MNNLRIFLCMVFLVFSVFSLSFAAEDDVIQKRAAELSEKKMTVDDGGSGKGSSPQVRVAEKGINNVFLGWTEIPKRIVDVTKESNPINGIVAGVFQGTVRAFSRTASGISDMATFPIGRYDDTPVLPGKTAPAH